VDATCVQFASSLAQGGKNSTLKGEEFPQVYGSHIIYKSFLAHGSHLQFYRCPHVSDIRSFVPHCTVHAPLLRQGRGHRTLTPNEIVLTFQAPDLCTKFHQNQTKNCDRRSADRQTYRQEDASYFIICPMLCDSNHGTDNKRRYPRL